MLTNSTHDSSGFPESKVSESFKMATSTDMKGNVVKMEVDYSDTVDKRIPECEELAAVCNLRFHATFCSWGYSFKAILCGTCWAFLSQLVFFFIVTSSHIILI